MAYYVALDTTAVKIRGDRAAEVEAVTLEHGSATVLPVFTSAKIFRGFFSTPSGEGRRINPMATYPFGLAEMVARIETKCEIEALVFDPVRIPPRRWRSDHDLIPVGYYLRFMREIRPGIQQLRAEAKARFGLGPPGSDSFATAIREQFPQLTKLAKDADAKATEWEA